MTFGSDDDNDDDEPSKRRRINAMTAKHPAESGEKTYVARVRREG